MNKKTLILFAGLFALAAVLNALGQTQSQTQPATRPTTQSGQSTSQFPTQAPGQGPNQPASPTSGSGPDMPSTVDGQGSKRYLVGPGDILDVRVYGQSDLNSTVEIDDEGNISSLPFLEDPLPAMCHTEKEIQRTIAEAYAKYLRRPRVSVRVLERKSRPPAVVYGAVRAPTRIQMMRRVRLHELLVAAGGITQNASGTIQIIHTEKELCADQGGIMRDVTISDSSVSDSVSDKPDASETQPRTASANDNVVVTSTSKPAATSISNKSGASSAYTSPGTTAYDQLVATSATKSVATSTSDKSAATSPSDKPLTDIGQIEIIRVGDVRTGLGGGDPYVRPGDIVIVTEGEPIYITGAVIQPGGIIMKEGMTLNTALAMSGGIQRLAKSHEVHIYRRKEEGKPGIQDLIIDYDAIKKGQKPDVLLQALDIIDVRNQSQWSAKSLTDFFLGITRSSLGGISGSLPYRVMY